MFQLVNIQKNCKIKFYNSKTLLFNVQQVKSILNTLNKFNNVLDKEDMFYILSTYQQMWTKLLTTFEYGDSKQNFCQEFFC